jgi:hypothetical protein
MLFVLDFRELLTAWPDLMNFRRSRSIKTISIFSSNGSAARERLCLSFFLITDVTQRGCR